MPTRSLSLLILVGAAAFARAEHAAPALPLLASFLFDTGAESLAHWEVSAPGCWDVVSDATDGGGFFSLRRRCAYDPPVRSPHSVALLSDVSVTDLDLRLRARSTTPDYPHRDLCVFFGVQDASHAYYAHLGLHADNSSHNVMIVDATARRPITISRSNGVPWDDGWHDLRVARDVQSGTIEVYFDGRLVLRAQDRTFLWGRVGVGSFDDTGDFDDIRLYGRRP